MNNELEDVQQLREEFDDVQDCKYRYLRGLSKFALGACIGLCSYLGVRQYQDSRINVPANLAPLSLLAIGAYTTKSMGDVGRQSFEEFMAQRAEIEVKEDKLVLG